MPVHQEILDLRYEPRRGDFQKPGRRLTLSNTISQRSTTFQPHPPTYSRENIEINSPASPCWSTSSQGSQSSPRITFSSMGAADTSELHDRAIFDSFDGGEKQRPLCEYERGHSAQCESHRPCNLEVKRVLSLPLTKSSLPIQPHSRSCGTPPHLTIRSNATIFQSPLSSPISPSRSPRSILPPINHWKLSKEDGSTKNSENDLQSNTSKQRHAQDMYDFQSTPHISCTHNDSPRQTRRTHKDSLYLSKKSQNESKSNDYSATFDSSTFRNHLPPRLPTDIHSTDYYPHQDSPSFFRETQTENKKSDAETKAAGDHCRHKDRLSQSTGKIRTNTSIFTDIHEIPEDSVHKDCQSSRSAKKTRSQIYSKIQEKSDYCEQNHHYSPSISNKIRSNTHTCADIHNSSRHNDRGSSSLSGKTRSNTYTSSDTSREGDTCGYKDRNTSASITQTRENKRTNSKKQYPREKEQPSKNSDDKKQESTHKTGPSFFPSILHPKRWSFPKLTREKQQPATLKKVQDEPVIEAVEHEDQVESVVKRENNAKQPRRSLYSFEEFLRLCEEEELDDEKA